MELSPQHNVSVDMSLARGLRGAVMKQITSSRLAMDRAGEMVFTRKSSMPTTKKGVRRLQAEMAKYLDKYALASNDLSSLKAEALWLHWTLRQNVALDTWEEDQLSVNGVIFNLTNPNQALRKFDYSIGLSMHLLERTFSRLNTTSNDQVLLELIRPTIFACAFWPFIYYELRNRGINSYSIMIPTRNGAVLGDFILDDNDGELHLRTFIGGKVEFSPSKAILLNELKEWESELNHQSLGDALQVSTYHYQDYLKCMENPVLVELQKVAQSYMAVLDRNSAALVEREARANNAKTVYKKWSNK